MKIKLKNVRISFPDIFKPSAKFNKFGAQFRFNEDSGYKALLEDTIDQQGTETWGTKWPAIKKSLIAKEKLFSVRSGAEKDYDEHYFITAHNAVRPEVGGLAAEPITADDRLIYAGCYVDAILGVSAYQHDTYGPVVSVKLLGVQFRKDGKPLGGGERATKADFEEIHAGADDEDL